MIHPNKILAAMRHAPRWDKQLAEAGVSAEVWLTMTRDRLSRVTTVYYNIKSAARGEIHGECLYSVQAAPELIDGFFLEQLLHTYWG